ncbi:MAG: TonB-dependent receptor [Gammaproteobacteria bacterium]
MKSDPHRGAVAVAVGLLFATTGVADDAPSEPRVLENVVVSAQKRGDENLQDVAMSATVISSETIDRQQLVGMDDYLRTIPGVTYQEYGAGRSTIVIRGVSADPQESVQTTGTYINEIPLTGLGDFGISSPELKLIDVERIEILRGPQGTLYGSSSVGGTVRIITRQPRLDAFGGSVAASLSSTGNPGGTNYHGEGVVNIPVVEDVFAVRAVGYRFEDSGYYRNVAATDPVKSAGAERTGALALNRDDVGSATFSGGRLAARWAPADRLTVDVMVLGQRIEQEGNPYADLRLGDFEQARYSRVSTGRSEYTEDDLGVWNLLVNYDAGPIALVSSTSWTDYQNTQDWDVGQFWTFLYEDDAPIFIRNDTDSDSFVQEIRLTSRWNRPVNFLAGLYYEDIDQTGHQIVEWDGDPAADPFAGDLMFDGRFRSQEEQRAFFGEVSWDIGLAWVATAGARRFSYETDFSEMADGFVVGGSYENRIDSKETGENYKFNLSYMPADGSLFYAQWSQGFNPGYPVSEIPGDCDQDGDGLVDGIGLPAPDQILADTLDSYELGTTLSLADGRVVVRGAAYYNEWNDIPILLVADCAVGFPFNAGEAMTAGVELEGSAQLGTRWRLDFGFGYTKAELTADAPGLGMDGDRLPGTPEYTGTLGLQFDTFVSGYDAWARGDLAYVGGFYNNLQEQGPEIGDYTTLNVSAGMRLQDWELQVFMHNVGDSDGATWIYRFEEYPSAFRLRPRTAGVKVRYYFGSAR